MISPPRLSCRHSRLRDGSVGPAQQKCHANRWGWGGWVAGVTTPGERFGLPLPGGTSVSHVKVYDTVGPDGLAGGSPHLHTVCTEAYLVIAGEGMVQTLSGEGYAETPLVHGTIAWFSPGTVHRLVNLDGRLELYVLMSNAGLPEAGDMVLAFEPGRSRRRRRATGAPPICRRADGRPTTVPTRRWHGVTSPSRDSVIGSPRSILAAPQPDSIRCMRQQSNSSVPGPVPGARSSTATRPPITTRRAPRCARSTDPSAGRAAIDRLGGSAVRSHSLLPATRRMGCCGTLGTVIH